MNEPDKVDRRRGSAGAATAMFCVGTLTAISPALHEYPVYGGQALRYAGGSLLLFAVARTRGMRAIRLSRREFGLVILLAITGLAAFNVFIIESTRYADPATVGTIVATVPIILALVGPLLEGRRPMPHIVLAAGVVASGAAIATGLGGGSPLGLLLALGALGCEVGFYGRDCARLLHGRGQPRDRSWLPWRGAVGPLSGRVIMSATVWLVAWAVLHLALRRRPYEICRAFTFTLILIFLDVLGTFPTFFQLSSNRSGVRQVTLYRGVRARRATPGAGEEVDKSRPCAGQRDWSATFPIRTRTVRVDLALGWFLINKLVRLFLICRKEFAAR